MSEWIPVTDRLPTDQDGLVWVTDKNGRVYRTCRRDISAQEFKAWMRAETPEPYKPPEPDTSLAASIDTFERAFAGGACHKTGDTEETKGCDCLVCCKHRILAAARKWEAHVDWLAAAKKWEATG